MRTIREINKQIEGLKNNLFAIEILTAYKNGDISNLSKYNKDDKHFKAVESYLNFKSSLNLYIINK